MLKFKFQITYFVGLILIFGSRSVRFSSVVMNLIFNALVAVFFLGWAVKFNQAIKCINFSSFWIWFLGGLPIGDRQGEMYGAAVVIGFGCSTLLVTSLAMTAELVGDNTVCSIFSYKLPKT